MLNVNLQFFAEGDPEEFDLDAFEKEFEESWEDEPEVEAESPEREEELPEEEELDKPEEKEELDSETELEDKDSPEDSEEPKFEKPDQNRAFADMRRQLEESQKYADFIKNIAEQNGMKPDDVLEMYQERQLQQKAEKEGLPVDVLKRLNEQESKIQQLEDQNWSEKFNADVEKVVKDQNLNDEQLQSVFNYMAQNGLDPRTNPNLKFEDAYFLANKESLREQWVKDARQKELEAKKKRQQTSAVPSGTSDSPKPNLDDEVEKEVLAFLKDNGDI